MAPLTLALMSYLGSTLTTCLALLPFAFDVRDEAGGLNIVEYGDIVIVIFEVESDFVPGPMKLR